MTLEELARHLCERSGCDPDARLAPFFHMTQVCTPDGLRFVYEPPRIAWTYWLKLAEVVRELTETTAYDKDTEELDLQF